MLNAILGTGYETDNVANKNPWPGEVSIPGQADRWHVKWCGELWAKLSGEETEFCL